jgi:CDP-glucose 4,6-dehydratase
VLEPLSGYLALALSLTTNTEVHGESFNFGPQAQQNHSVLELVKEMSLYWDKVSWRDVSKIVEGPYESSLLKLNCDKALHHLNWHAVMTFEQTVRMTADWYRIYYQNPASILDVTNSQISTYSEIAKQNQLAWSS